MFGVEISQELESDIVRMALAYARSLVIYHQEGDGSSHQHIMFMHSELNDLCYEAAQAE